ncbi:MAG: hypothetical protein AAF909_09970 [Pseudomonadota bacterium]
MLLGHYGAALAAKAAAPSVPLPALMLGTQLIDVVWALLLLAGVERVRIQPGYSAASPLVLEYFPYSHSLPAALLISALGAGALAVLEPGLSTGALGVAAALIFSHWALDWLVHQPDLPLWGDRHKVGLGLWSNKPVSVALEFGLFAIGAALFLGGLSAEALAAAWLPLTVVLGGLAALQAYAFMGPPPGSPRELALTALAVFALATLGGAWIEAAL